MQEIKPSDLKLISNNPKLYLRRAHVRHMGFFTVLRKIGEVQSGFINMDGKAWISHGMDLTEHLPLAPYDAMTLIIDGADVRPD
jgi:hypothetical protein